jgi:hypothetical protein
MQSPHRDNRRFDLLGHGVGMMLGRARLILQACNPLGRIPPQPCVAALPADSIALAQLGHLGRRHGVTELFTRDARTYEAQTTDVLTLYVRFGDWIGSASIAAVAILLTLAWWRGRRARP